VSTVRQHSSRFRSCTFVLVSLLLLCYLGVNAYVSECNPRDGRALLDYARVAAGFELKTSGRIDNIESVLRMRHPETQRWLKRYRVRVQYTNAGYEIWVEPRRFGFCKPTYH
jgi:hypothetical protein